MASVVEVPALVVAETDTAPGVLEAGVVTVMDVVLVKVTIVAALAPKSIVVPPETKLVPVTTTEVPPSIGPLVGATLVTEGSPAAAAGDTPTAVSATPKLPRKRATPRAVFEKPTSGRVLRYDLTGLPSPFVMASRRWTNAPKAGCVPSLVFPLSQLDYMPLVASVAMKNSPFFAS